MKNLRSLDEVKKLLQDEPIVSKVIEAAVDSNTKVYLVGGPVRDLLIGESVLDYDFIVIGDVHKLAKILARALGAKKIVRTAFLTSKIIAAGVTIDLAHARKEKYPHPGALPIVESTDDIKEDLGRRDFTINAMAIKLPEFRLIDPFDGVDDLKNGIIRVLHTDSFVDDPTRAFRAVRYRNRFGFRYDELTESEFRKAKKWIPKLSFERIRNELKRMAKEQKRAEMFIEVSQRGLLFGLSADSETIKKIDQKLGDRSEEHWIAFFAAFLLNSRFNWKVLPLTRWESKILAEIVQGLQIEVKDIEKLHLRVRKFDEISVKVLSAVRDEIFASYERRRHLGRPFLSSEQLQRLGVPQNQLFGKIIALLEAGHISGRLKTVEDEIRFVKEFLKEEGIKSA